MFQRNTYCSYLSSERTQTKQEKQDAGIEEAEKQVKKGQGSGREKSGGRETNDTRNETNLSQKVSNPLSQCCQVTGLKAQTVTCLSNKDFNLSFVYKGKSDRF